MKTFLTLILTLTLALTTLGAGAEENILQDKDRGAAVRMMQEMLHRKQSSDVKVDGIFGGDTTEYLRAYQSRNGLEPTGKLDVKTKSVLYAPCDYKVYRMECDWETANDIALELGGYLASIDTPEAYDKLAAKLQNFQDATLWIGARRYRRHTFDHSQYYWIKDDGLSTLDPISQTPGDSGIHWAAGEPSFRSADNNQQPEYYVRTRCIDNCWVLEDSTEQADGFIVAFTDDDSLQKAPDDGPLAPLLFLRMRRVTVWKYLVWKDPLL